MKPVLHTITLLDDNGETYTATALCDMYTVYDDGALLLSNVSANTTSLFSPGRWLKVEAGTPVNDDTTQEFTIDGIVYAGNAMQLDEKSGAISINHYRTIEDEVSEDVLNAPSEKDVAIEYRLILAFDSWETLEFEEVLEDENSYKGDYIEAYKVDDSTIYATRLIYHPSQQVAFFQTISRDTENPNVVFHKIIGISDWVLIESERLEEAAYDSISDILTFVVNGNEEVQGTAMQYNPLSGVLALQTVVQQDAYETDDGKQVEAQSIVLHQYFRKSKSFSHIALTR